MSDIVIKLIVYAAVFVLDDMIRCARYRDNH